MWVAIISCSANKYTESATTILICLFFFLQIVLAKQSHESWEVMKDKVGVIIPNSALQRRNHLPRKAFQPWGSIFGYIPPRP
jgi:hypothetical protein